MCLLVVRKACVCLDIYKYPCAVHPRPHSHPAPAQAGWKSKLNAGRDAQVPQIRTDRKGGVLLEARTREKRVEDFDVMRRALRLSLIHAAAVAEASVLHAPSRFPLGSRNRLDVWRLLVVAAGTGLHQDDGVAAAVLPGQVGALREKTWV